MRSRPDNPVCLTLLFSVFKYPFHWGFELDNSEQKKIISQALRNLELRTVPTVTALHIRKQAMLFKA